MSKIKKKLNVIRPTLRHRKIYFKISYSKENNSSPYLILSKNYENNYGLFSLISSNLTLMDYNKDLKNFVVRINKDYGGLFLSTLFFLKQDFGLIYVQKEASTLKSLQ